MSDSKSKIPENAVSTAGSVSNVGSISTAAVSAAGSVPEDVAYERELADAPDAATADAIRIDREKGNFHYAEDYAFDAGTGLNA
ncbi:MAG: hypothetical protein LBR07_04310, partial [Puniceicoccales bacterium]|nr:hypothetical protein [Puniceicoccales bacterium]